MKTWETSFQGCIERTLHWSALSNLLNTRIAWKVCVFGVILVRIFLHSDWIWRDYLSVSIFPYSIPMRENADQNNCKYKHFFRSVVQVSVKDGSNIFFCLSIKYLITLINCLQTLSFMENTENTVSENNISPFVLVPHFHRRFSLNECQKHIGTYGDNDFRISTYKKEETKALFFEMKNKFKLDRGKTFKQLHVQPRISRFL